MWAISKEKSASAGLKVKVLIFLLIYFLAEGWTAGQIIRTFSADFSREYRTETQKEKIDGEIYYDGELQRLLIKVTRPLNQWMVFAGNVTLIYYPDEGKAFRIKSRNPASLPFFQVLLGVIKDDFGLSDLGYTFMRHETKNKRLLSMWAPPKKYAGLAGEMVLVYEDNKLVSVESKSPKGALVSQAVFSRHIAYYGFHFPMDIKLTTVAKSGSTDERVSYNNPRFNLSLPPEVKSFAIPKNVPVKEIVW